MFLGFFKETDQFTGMVYFRSQFRIFREGKYSPKQAEKRFSAKGGGCSLEAGWGNSERVWWDWRRH